MTAREALEACVGHEPPCTELGIHDAPIEQRRAALLLKLSIRARNLRQSEREARGCGADIGNELRDRAARAALKDIAEVGIDPETAVVWIDGASLDELLAAWHAARKLDEPDPPHPYCSECGKGWPDGMILRNRSTWPPGWTFGYPDGDPEDGPAGLKWHGVWAVCEACEERMQADEPEDDGSSGYEDGPEMTQEEADEMHRQGLVGDLIELMDAAAVETVFGKDGGTDQSAKKRRSGYIHVLPRIYIERHGLQHQADLDDDSWCAVFESDEICPPDDQRLVQVGQIGGTPLTPLERRMGILRWIEFSEEFNDVVVLDWAMVSAWRALLGPDGRMMDVGDTEPDPTAMNAIRYEATMRTDPRNR